MCFFFLKPASNIVRTITAVFHAPPSPVNIVFSVTPILLLIVYVDKLKAIA